MLYGDEVVLVGDGDGLGGLVHATPSAHQVVVRSPVGLEGVVCVVRERGLEGE